MGGLPNTIWNDDHYDIFCDLSSITVTLKMTKMSKREKLVSLVLYKADDFSDHIKSWRRLGLLVKIICIIRHLGGLFLARKNLFSPLLRSKNCASIAGTHQCFYDFVIDSCYHWQYLHVILRHDHMYYWINHVKKYM